MITQLATRENIVAVSFAQEIADQAPPEEIALITTGKYLYKETTNK